MEVKVHLYGFNEEQLGNVIASAELPVGLREEAAMLQDLRIGTGLEWPFTNNEIAEQWTVSTTF